MARSLVRFAPVLLATILAGGVTLSGCWGSSGTESKPAAGGATLTSPPETMVGSRLATVNGAPVGSLAFDALAQRKTPADGKAFSAEEKKEVLDQAVVDELLFQEAFRRGLYHDPKVRKILVNILLRAEVYDNVHNEDFTEDQLKAFFEQHKEEFVVPEKIQIKRIFLQIGPDRDQAAAEKLGTELAAKIKADPESFTQLAQEHSNDPFARRGGDLGYLAREGKPGVPVEIVTRAFNMQTGEISAPFSAAGGVNVLYVANRRDRIERTFEQMRGSVLRRMKNDKFEEMSKAFVEKLRGAAKIAVDDAALGAYNPAPPSRPSLPLPGADAPMAMPPGADGAPPAGDPLEELSENEQIRKAMQENEAGGE